MEKMEARILGLLLTISCLNFIHAQEIPMNLASAFTLPPINGGVDLGPVALENWSATGDSAEYPSSIHSKYTGNFVDCSTPATTLCNQGAWADFGLAISGLIPRNNLCAKYSPSTSCISTSLTHCNRTLSGTTNTMMIAFGRVVVSWCYDGGVTLTALDTYGTCLSVAMFDALTIRNCLTQINDPNAVGKPVANNEVADPRKTLLTLPRLFNNVIDTYQSSTIVCMHASIAEACGQEAAQLALGPAMDELNVPTPGPSTPATIPVDQSVLSNQSDSIDHNRSDTRDTNDIFSKSRQFMNTARDVDARSSNAGRCDYRSGLIILLVFTIMYQL